MKIFSRIPVILCICAVLICGTESGNLSADEGYRIISTQELEQWLRSDAEPFVVFALSEVEYEEAHIPDSVCIPVEEMGTLGRLPAGLDTPIVFYCHGPG